MCWNVQGLQTKLNNENFISFCNVFDIFALSEINACKEDSIIKSFPNYEVFIAGRLGYKGGGVCVLVKKSFSPYIKKIEVQIDECIILLATNSVIPGNENVFLCFPYVAHENSIVYTDKVLKGIELLEQQYMNTCLTVNDNIPWFIGGDMNARTGEVYDVLLQNNLQDYCLQADCWSDLFDNVSLPGRQSPDKDTNNFGLQLIQFCKTFDLFILNGRTKGDTPGKVTCVANGGMSVIDYMLLSKSMEECVDTFEVLPRTESDHFPICLNLFAKSVQHASSTDVFSPEITPIYKLMWDNDSKEQYCQSMNLNLNEKFSEFKENCENEQIDEAVIILNNCIRESTLERKVKRKKSNIAKSQPKWFDKECEESKQLKYRALRDFHFANCKQKLDIYLNSKRKFKQVCKTKKKKYNETQSEILLENSLKSNTKDFWRQIKAVTDPKSTISNTISPGDWFGYFNNLLNPTLMDNHENITIPNFNADDENDSSLNSPPIGSLNTENNLEKEITSQEIRNAIKKLKRGKACGPDGISPEFYMLEFPVFINYLFILFNAVFASGVYPSEWSKSMIFPLHKKGNINNVNNYRGISLLNILGKIFSHVLNERLKQWCDCNNIIPEAQAGFRSSYSTVDNIFVLQSLVQKYIGKAGGRFYVFFVDFQKAFDRINRGKLWLILQKNGCEGKMLTILKSMYDSVLSSIRIVAHNRQNSHDFALYSKYDMSYNTCITDYFECMSGVKQGCILSPILFSIFISQLDKELANSNVQGIELSTNETVAYSLLYADDLVLFSDNVIDMQKKIDALNIFCLNWDLKVNIDKSKMMVFRNGGYLKQTEKWWINKTRIESVTYYSYLGILFSSRLSWSKWADNQACKASKIIFKIRNMFNRLESINCTTALKIFDAKIKPMVLYGSEIWGTKAYECIEHIQIRFIKTFLGVGKSTENHLVLKEMGRYPLWVETKFRAIKYWCKLIHLNNERYAKKCYTQQYKQEEMGRKNWAAEVKMILYNTGFGFVWQSQQLGDIESFLTQFKERLISTGLQTVESSIREHFDSYLNIHPIFEVAYYINVLKTIRIRRLITQLRTRSLPIRNNLYRINIVKDNKCSRCPLKKIDDEFHFLLECSAHVNERSKYLPAHLYKNPSSNTLEGIMRCKDINILKSVGSYIYNTLKEDSFEI